MQNSGSAPPIDINSPGEPRFVTFYQALESASIRNENLGVEDVSQRQRLTGVVTKVDPNATVPNGAGNDIANNNDTTASIATITSSPDITTIDITTVQSADNSLTSRLGTENSIDDSPETTTMIQIPTNPGTNGRETTPVSFSESLGTTVNTITNTPLSYTNVPDTTEPFTNTETVTLMSVANVTSATLSSTKSASDDIRFTEPINTKTMEIGSLPFTETMNASVSILASQNLQTSNTSDTTVSPPITENVTVTHILPETTIVLETNTVQQSDETMPRATETTDYYIVEDIETNTVQQFDTTIPQITKTTRIAEPTTEEISNDIIEIRATAAPVFTSTYHTRLIDYTQNILSHLSQKSFSTVRTSTITTTELSNTVPDSSSTNTENPAQPEETTTVLREIEPETVSLDVDIELVPTTTNGPEVSTRNTVDSNSTSNFKSTTTAQDMRAPSINEEVATLTSRLVDSIMENDPRSSNDTLLAELMTIAKTLFTEAMNDTRQSIHTDGTVGNDDKNRSMSSNGTSEATTAPSELSKSLESTIERIDVIARDDLSGNEREDNSTRGPVVGSKISLVESNARPAENPVDVGDIITMSFSQIKTETPNIIMVTDSMNSELTTNTPDSQLSNPIGLSNNNTEQQTITTVANNKVELSNRLLEFIMDLSTNNPLMSPVTMNIERILPNVNISMTSDMEMELTTGVAMTEINVVQTNAIDTTNQTPEPFTISASDLQITNDRSLVANASDIATILPTVSDTNDTQPLGTEPPVTESVRNLTSSIDITTNRFNDITTNIPQTLIDLISEMPNLITRLQDTTTTTTAQGTAGSRFIQPEQTTEITTSTFIIPNVTASAITPITNSTMFPASSTNATTILSSSVESTITTTTTTSITAFRTTSTKASSYSELTTTVEPTSETTTTTVDINENLVSTETTTDTSITQGTTITSNESEDLNATSKINGGEAITTTTTSAIPPTNTSTTTTTSTTARTTVLNRISPSSTFTPFGTLNTKPYLRRFGGNQMMSTPGFSSSKAPIRDYLIYGIYPNKTIVRKRPEDNLIDGRNVDSPYVIFGIYPDGRLVRKFPNGTIIPDSSRNPVEIVFTLRTSTTTNRPSPRPYYNNQANQAGIYNNQYQAPVYNNNGRPLDELTGGAKNPGSLDFGFISNAIGITPGGPNFAGPLGLPANVPSTNKMVSLSHLFIKIVILYAQRV